MEEQKKEAWKRKLSTLGPKENVLIYGILCRKKHTSKYRAGLRKTLEGWLNGEPGVGFSKDSPFTPSDWRHLGIEYVKVPLRFL